MEGETGISAYEETLDDVLGNEDSVSQLKKYADEIDNKVKRKPLMVFGPPGTGKSMAVRLIAKQHNWHVVELNASDYRDKESIEKLMLAAAQSRNIFGKKNAILFDEIDELAPRFDKGASSAISNIIENSKNPIIFIANDMWDLKIAFLRKITEPVNFRKLDPLVVSQILTKYAKATGINVSESTIQQVSIKSNGDARSAINDIIILDGAPDSSVEIIGMRDRKADIFSTLDKIFYSNTYSAPLMAAANSDVENDMLIRWIDENIPKKYTDKKDLAQAYQMLSTASMFGARASRSQYYTYWRYMNALVSSGVALSKSSYPDRTRRYTFPKTISELSQTKERRSVRLEIAKKLRKRIHVSNKRIIKDEMKILAAMARSAMESKDDNAIESMNDFFISKYGLEQKEVKWLVENVVG